MTDIDQLVSDTAAARAERPFDPAEYETVAVRVGKFWAAHPDGRISTEVVNSTGEIGATRWVVRASVWTSRTKEHPDATGLAVETDGQGDNITSAAALETAETSAIGRALANLGIHGKHRASADEIAKAAKAPAVRKPRRPRTTTKVSDA